MRLVIDLDKKYKNLFYEVARAADAIIIEEDSDTESSVPEHVKSGIVKSLEQAKNGQVKSFAEVKEIIAHR